jgi:glucosamine--fructose-6-phosphate aminotransferase (isomerizing)
MTEHGVYSHPEILTQAAAWQGALDAVLAQREALAAFWDRAGDERVIFAGCGSTHCLAQFAAPFFQRVTGRVSRALPSSELALQTDSVVAPSERPTVVALSRSAETSETVMAVDAMRARGGQALTITCYGDAILAQHSDLAIEVVAGREESWAQTRSFAGMLVAAQALAALLAEDEALLADLARLPALAADLMARVEPVARRIGADESIRRITYLGSGPLYGLANEATIKMKEMSLAVAEGFHFMEFRHGPMALVDREHLVVALVGDTAREYEVAVLRDLRDRGARVVAVAESDAELTDVCEEVVTVGSGLPAAARSVLYLPFVQLLAYHRAMGCGQNPDRPRNVVAAIHLDGTEMSG